MELSPLTTSVDATTIGISEWLDIIDTGLNSDLTSMGICFACFAHESNP